jgi:hypothetical protein
LYFGQMLLGDRILALIGHTGAVQMVYSAFKGLLEPG